MLTIIGAHSFHGPVRDGKGWVRKAIAAKRRGWKDVVTGVGHRSAFGEVVTKGELRCRLGVVIAAYCVFYLERCSISLYSRL